MAGKLYLVPIPIAAGKMNTLSEDISRKTEEIKHFFVENIRTARRFLKALHPHLDINERQFSEIDKHNGAEISLFKKWLNAGVDVGLLSEAGCPGVADPGAGLVSLAHELGFEVIPLVGPNAIILALMGSGLNGQNFCFHGYLPVKEPSRSKKIRQLEEVSRQSDQTQIFIETPYRNGAVWRDLLHYCQNTTRVCIAINITAESAFIQTKTVRAWKADPFKPGKEPAVFLIHA